VGLPMGAFLEETARIGAALIRTCRRKEAASRRLGPDRPPFSPFRERLPGRNSEVRKERFHGV